MKKYTITPGEAVGTIVAQTIGERSTQLTMRTFHLAGVATVSLTQGFSRLKELVDAVKTPKNPYTFIYLKNPEKAKDLINEFEEKTIDDFCFVDLDMENRQIVITVKKEYESEIILEEIKEYLEKNEVKDIKIKNNKIIIATKDKIKASLKLTEKIRDILIRGIKGLKKVYLDKTDDGEAYLLAEGTNLIELLKHPEVDETRTYSNDIKEIENVFGIEAARNLLVEEINNVLLSNDMEVDMRHILLIADAMCFYGSVLAVGRQGLAGRKQSVLARAAFEESVKHILNAGIKGEIDPLKGVAENIIVGKVCPVGTGKIILEVNKDEFE